MQVQVIVNSAHSLKNVNWRYGMLHPYAVVWIDTSHKCSTKVDMNNGMNPVWDEKFTIPLPPTSFPETAMLCIDIVHANAPVGTKPLVGSARFPINASINEARAHGTVSLCLNLTRPSGRPQGTIEIKIGLKDQNIGHINQYNQQQTPYKQHLQAQPLPQVQMQPLTHLPPQAGKYQPQPQVQPQGQFQPRPQVQLQGQFQPRLPVQPQGQFQPRPHVQPQGQFQHRPQIQPQGQYVPQLQPHQPQGQYQPQPMVKLQGKQQDRPQAQAQGQPQYRPDPKLEQQKSEAPMKKQPHKPAPVQLQSQYQPNPKLQLQKQEVQPMKKQPNKQAPVQTPNSKGPVRKTPAQGPRNSMPPGTNMPQNRQRIPGPAQQQYNPGLEMGPGADAIRLRRDMIFVQNNIEGLSNNGNSTNAGRGGAGSNDNGETKSAAAEKNANGANGETKSTAAEENNYGELKSAPGEANNSGETMSSANADNAVDESNVENTEVLGSADAFNDAESIHLSYGETQYESLEQEIGGYDHSEFAATKEYGHGGYDVNAGHGEYGSGGYNAIAGAECDYGTYDVNTGVDCNYGAYDENAGVECEYGAYDVTGEECNYGGFENGTNDYVNEPYDGTYEGAGLESQVECGEVAVSSQY